MYNWPANAEMASIKHSQLQKLAPGHSKDLLHRLSEPGNKVKGDKQPEVFVFHVLKHRFYFPVEQVGCKGNLYLLKISRVGCKGNRLHYCCFFLGT